LGGFGPPSLFRASSMSIATTAPERQRIEPARTELSESGKKYARRKALRPYVILAPAFLLTIGIVIPFVVAIFYSFTDLTLRSSEYNLIGFDNFVATFTSSDFWHSVSVTLQYAFWSTGVEMLLGIGIALLLNEENWVSKALRLVLIFPLMIAPVIGALVWQLMTNPSVGILRFPLAWIGLGDFRWSADPNFALFSVVLIDVWIYTPFVVILVLAGLRSLPKSPYEAAMIDGGSSWFVFRNLTLPMLAPVLLIALVFRLMTSLQEFAIIFASTKGGPGDRTLSVSIKAYNEAFPFYDLSGSIPMLLFLWVLIYAICFVLIGFWRKAQKAASGAA
jgi:multiple sugar transport system permease protein